MVFTQEQQLADHIKSISRKDTERCWSAVHANVKTVHNDTPITAETHSIIKDRGCF